MILLLRMVSHNPNGRCRGIRSWDGNESNVFAGFLNFGQYPYKDASGFNLDNQALVFQVQLPKSSNPS